MKNKRLELLYIKINKQDKYRQKMDELQREFRENVINKTRKLERICEKWVRKTKD